MTGSSSGSRGPKGCGRTPKECPLCGQTFDALHNQIVCHGCRNRYRNSKKNARNDVRSSGGDPSISLARLYIRDGPLCAQCGVRTDINTDMNDPRHPSVDHIIPLSKGGLHEWDNVRILCRKCNCVKSNRIFVTLESFIDDRPSRRDPSHCLISSTSNHDRSHDNLKCLWG